jgi:hypothetical protein
MSTSGIVIRYIGWGVNLLTPRKYAVLNGNFVFDLHNVFQERNPGVKRDLSVYDHGHIPAQWSIPILLTFKPLGPE